MIRSGGALVTSTPSGPGRHIAVGLTVIATRRDTNKASAPSTEASPLDGAAGAGPLNDPADASPLNDPADASPLNDPAEATPLDDAVSPLDELVGAGTAGPPDFRRPRSPGTAGFVSRAVGDLDDSTGPRATPTWLG